MNESKLTPLEALINALQDVIVSRVLEELEMKASIEAQIKQQNDKEPAAPSNFEESVAGILQNADWFKALVTSEVTEHIEGGDIDWEPAVSKALRGMDLSSEVQSEFQSSAFDQAVDERLDNYDFEDRIKEEVKKLDFTVSVS